MKTVFIYALCEPDTAIIRYVGKTDDIKRRLAGHLSQSVKFKSHLGDWLRKLKASGEVPNLVVLCEVEDGSWESAEIEQISIARGMGFMLVNGTPGGEGGWTGNPGTGAKISASKIGKPRSIETRLRVSEGLKGLKQTEETRSKRSRSRKAFSFRNNISVDNW